MSDSTKETGSKIDYYSILKRRKRTIESFISEFGITSFEEAQNVFKELSKEFDVSEDFKNLVILAVAPFPIPSVLDEESFRMITENGPELPVVVEPDVQRPKKRSKKEI